MTERLEDDWTLGKGAVLVLTGPDYIGTKVVAAFMAVVDISEDKWREAEDAVLEETYFKYSDYEKLVCQHMVSQGLLEEIPAKEWRTVVPT